MGSCAFTPFSYTKRFDNKVQLEGVVTFSDSYSTGGDSLDLSDYFASDADLFVMITPKFVAPDRRVIYDGGDATNAKLLMYTYDISLDIDFVEEDYSMIISRPQVTGATDLSTYQCDIIVIGNL